ncbi:hypothetical protein D3C80_2123810 [compost metagenome]
METATAMNSRTCIGTRALENPGMIMMQPPIRQKAANSASTVPSGSVIMKWSR